MRDVVRGSYKLQIWRGVCRRKALLNFVVMDALLHPPSPQHRAGTYISETKAHSFGGFSVGWSCTFGWDSNFLSHLIASHFT